MPSFQPRSVLGDCRGVTSSPSSSHSSQPGTEQNNALPRPHARQVLLTDHLHFLTIPKDQSDACER